MRWLAKGLVVLSLAAGLPAQAQPAEASHVQVELVSGAQGVAPGGTVQVALHEKIQTGWHTYWTNPGDAGEPVHLDWTLPTGWTASEIVWPAPGREPVGPLMSYGYRGEVLLPLTLTAPKTARVGDTAVLHARGEILVCADVCVPQDLDLTPCRTRCGPRRSPRPCRRRRSPTA